MTNLCNETSCTNCGLCAQICPGNAISLTITHEGAHIPHIDADKCLECGLCKKKCPQITTFKLNDTPTIYAGWHKSIATRRKSSSGGVFSAIAENFIKMGGVVFGATFDENLNLRHTRATNTAGLRPMRGSKYVQSDLTKTYPPIRQDLEAGKKVLFVGTPCQVAAIKRYAEHLSENLYTIDLVCHGVPSQKVFHTFLNSIGVSLDKVATFSFRWTIGKSYCLAADGKELPLDKQYYLKAFTKGFILNRACYECKYANKQRVGDLTIGDFWGLGLNQPFAHSQRSGISLVLSNNEKGASLLSLSADSLNLEQRTMAEATAYNRGLTHPCVMPKERDFFVKDLLNGMPYKAICKTYNIAHISIKDRVHRIKHRILNILINSTQR